MSDPHAGPISVRAMRSNWWPVTSLIVLGGIYAVVPSLLGVVQNGRNVKNNLSEAAPPSVLGGHLATACSSLMLIVCFVVIVTGFRDRILNAPGSLAIYVLPLLIVFGVDLHLGYVPSYQVVLYPSIGLALWILRPPIAAFRPLGLLTVSVAAVSLAMGILTPDLGFYANPGGFAVVDKAIIGTRLLAGPLGHPNLLGSLLAFGAPFVALLRTQRWRIAGLTLILVALLWTSARTAILAFAVTVFVWAMLRVKNASRRAWFVLAAVVGATLTVATPLLTTDPAAFTFRGQIWIQSLAFDRHHAAIGSGTNIFAQLGAAGSQLGTYAFTGHNLFVDTYTKLGIVGLIGYSIWLIVLSGRALKLSAISDVGLLWVVSLAYQSYLEARLDFTNMGQVGVVVWLPVAAILFSATDSPEQEPAGRTSVSGPGRSPRRPARVRRVPVTANF